MKKQLLLSGAMAAACILSMSAKTELYMPDLDMFAGTTTIGKVSANGQFVVAADDDNIISYLWDKSNPTEWTKVETGDEENVKGCAVRGVSNDGKTLVGTLILKNAGNQNSRAAYMRDGKWNILPSDPNVLNTIDVMGCNSDASIIFGYQFIKVPGSDKGGMYYPCEWILNGEGEYDLKSYNDLPLPEHQGFIPWCMSEDGSMIGGTLFVPAASSIPAIVWDGELVYFDELETRIEPTYYKGEIIGEWPEYYINGYHDSYDGNGCFEGSFMGLDAEGKFYGYRSRVFEVGTDPEKENYGKGTLVNGATVYDSKDKKWYDFEKFQAFSIGLDGKYIFTNGGQVTDLKGKDELITNKFDVTTTAVNPCITHVSEDGQTLAGIHSLLNPAIGGYDYFPFVLVLDEPLVTPKDPDTPDNPDQGYINIVKGDEEVNIVLTPGRIDVCGVESARIFDLDGRALGEGTTFHVAPGVYVVATGNNTYKVLVK